MKSLHLRCGLECSWTEGVSVTLLHEPLARYLLFTVRKLDDRLADRSALALLASVPLLLLMTQ